MPITEIRRDSEFKGSIKRKSASMAGADELGLRGYVIDNFKILYSSLFNTYISYHFLLKCQENIYKK